MPFDNIKCVVVYSICYDLSLPWQVQILYQLIQQFHQCLFEIHFYFFVVDFEKLKMERKTTLNINFRIY